MHRPEPVSAANITAHLRELTEGIGVRLAGSDGEANAAAYVKQAFAHAGTEVSVESFPMKERRVTHQCLEVCLGGQWVAFPCSPFSSTPGTAGRILEAPLCFFESAAEYRRKDLSHLHGKAVIHLGCHIESRECYRRLMEAGPAFLLLVDVRYPGTVPLADGMFPAYTRAAGAVPTVNVAFMDAWRWKLEGAAAARLMVEGGMRDSTSQNVVADLPGSDPDAEILIVGGHHDTQADSVGADDNADGVATVLELAHVLAPVQRKRGLRLISFGTEEQLSVGSATYVRQHRAELQERARFMLNFDSFGSHLGWTELVCNGPQAMADFLVSRFEAADLFMRPVQSIVPYADHFPFVAAGVPGAFVFRSNCTAGRFFHHRPDDDMSRVSPDLIARTVSAAADLLFDLLNVDDMPFSTDVPQDVADQVQAFWQDLFGGWQPE